MTQGKNPPSPDGQSSTARRIVPPLLIGLLLPLLILGLTTLFGRSALEKNQSRHAVDPLALQSDNLSALEREAEMYRRALEQEPCQMPLLSGPGETLLQNPAPAAPPAAGQAPPADGQALPPRPANMVEMVEQATVLVLSKSPQGMGNGSGFFVGPDLIMTNRHVVDGATELFVTNKALGQLIPARVLARTRSEELRDYAFLSITVPAGRRPPVLSLLAAGASRADRVSAWGYPALLTKTDPKLTALLAGDNSQAPEVVYTEGVVSVVQEYHGLPLVNHTADVSPGSSGGPLVDGQGRVVGINTMIRIDEASNRQVNIAFSSADILQFSAGLGLALTKE